MPLRTVGFCLLVAFLVTAPSRAQTAREAAVAIDAIAIPAIDDGALEPIVSGLRFPWSMAFLPDGRMLIVEQRHGVRLLNADGTLDPVMSGGPPHVFVMENSGFLDIVLDPDFAINRLVYLAFVEGDNEANRTAIWRARFDGRRMTQGRVIFHVNVPKRGPSHPSGRMLFLPDETLLLTVGDGYDYRDAAQDMRSHLGKVLRLTRDGRPAPDNPFVGRTDVAPEVWSSGHRNIQGLAIDPETGAIWSTDHGPRGGDELNLLRAGGNYGWPIVSHGIDYDGTLITERSSAPEFERSAFYWAPAIAPSGLTIYRGDRYPDFVGKHFVGGLAARSLLRMRTGVDTGLLVEEARMFAGLRERIRDIRTGPDGYLYMLTESETGRLIRLAPTAAASVARSTRSTGDLSFWIGRWEGEATFAPAFTTGATSRAETIRAECRPALSGAYVQCDAVFRAVDGREHGAMWLWNFNEIAGEYELTTLASDHGQSTTIQVRWDASENAFVGLTPARTADDRAAMKRFAFSPSTDRNTIRGLEMIRPNNHNDGQWVQTLEFVLRRQGD